LYELGSSVDVQKDTIGEKAGLGQVAGPHLEVVLGDLDSLILLEVLGQLSDLFEILSPEHLFYQHVQELQDFLSHFFVHLLLLAQVKGRDVFKIELTLLTIGCRGDYELIFLVHLHSED